MNSFVFGMREPGATSTSARSLMRGWRLAGRLGLCRLELPTGTWVLCAGTGGHEQGESGGGARGGGDRRGGWELLHVGPPGHVDRDMELREDLRHAEIGKPAAVLDACVRKSLAPGLRVSYSKHFRVETK